MRAQQVDKQIDIIAWSGSANPHKSTVYPLVLWCFWNKDTVVTCTTRCGAREEQREGRCVLSIGRAWNSNCHCRWWVVSQGNIHEGPSLHPSFINRRNLHSDWKCRPLGGVDLFEFNRRFNLIPIYTPWNIQWDHRSQWDSPPTHTLSYWVTSIDSLSILIKGFIASPCVSMPVVLVPLIWILLADRRRRRSIKLAFNGAT